MSGSASDQIARINTLTQTARTSWFAFLSYFAFVTVALMGVEDADFFIPERQTSLPIVGITIPTFLFFALAPALGLLIFTYFHLHLIKLWEALGEAKPTTGKGFIGDRITPWLISDFALSRRADDAIRFRPLRVLANLATLILVFCFGPAVLTWFWWRSFPAHSEAMTVIAIGLPLSLALYVAWRSWAYLRSCAAAKEHSKKTSPISASYGFWLILLATSIFGWFKTEGTLDYYARTVWGLDVAYLDADERPWWSGTPYPDFLASAQLAGVDFVGMPDDWRDYETAREAFRVQWCKAGGIPTLACGSGFRGGKLEQEAIAILWHQRQQWCGATLPTGADNSRLTQAGRCRAYFRRFDAEFAQAWRDERRIDRQRLTTRDLSGRDLRHANLFQAKLVGADLASARLEGADLSRAQLEGADFSQARLQNSNLLFARLDAADMTEMLADKAGLFRASLRDSDLKVARLIDADVSGADFSGASLISGRLLGITARGANFSDTDLRGAKLEGGRFARAIFRDSNMDGARVDGADFSRARMIGALLIDLKANETTNFTQTNFSYANFGELDLSKFNITQEQADSMYASGTITGLHLPKGVKRPPHWPTEDLRSRAFQRKWRAWQRAQGYEAVDYRGPVDRRR